jgi:endoglucanase
MVVKGNRIVGSLTQQPVRATGMSFYWDGWAGKFYNRGMVDRLVDDMQCEIVRAAFAVEDGGNPFGNEGNINAVVQAAIDRGVYVVIDYHAHYAHRNTGAAIGFFDRMAQKWGKYDNVIFEIFNEPKYTDWPVVKAYAEQIIPVIRKYSDNIIIVGTPNWSQFVDHAADNPLKDPNDPSKLAPNVAYTLHFYANTHKDWLRQVGDYALNKGFALMVTEYGGCDADGGGPINRDETRRWFQWMKERELSSMAWSVNDIGETSSIFQGGGYSEWGNFVKSLIIESTANAPWRP